MRGKKECSDAAHKIDIPGSADWRGALHKRRAGSLDGGTYMMWSAYMPASIVQRRSGERGRAPNTICDSFAKWSCDTISLDLASPFMLASASKLTLASAKCGDRLRVRHICPDCPHCVRLREMGFHDRTVVRKIADGAAVICLLLGTRVAVGRELCDHVEVERLAA